MNAGRSLIALPQNTTEVATSLEKMRSVNAQSPAQLRRALERTLKTGGEGMNLRVDEHRKKMGAVWK